MTGKLWHAIGKLSDRTVAGSDEENVRRVFRAYRRRRIQLVSTLAACFCFCIIAGLCLIPLVMGHYGAANKHDPGADSMAPGRQPNGVERFSVGSTADGNGGHLTFLSYAEGRATFRLENTEDAAAPLSVVLCATQNGQETEYTAAEGGVTVTVDGAPSPDGALPAARGTYQIILDVSGWRAESGTLTGIRINGYGRFALPGA